MSRDWNTAAKFSLGSILLLGIAAFPLPGRSVEDQPLEVGDYVYLKFDPAERPCQILGIDHKRSTILLMRGDGKALVAAWECVPAE